MENSKLADAKRAKNDEFYVKLPIPKTLRNEYSNSVEENYWVNTCPYCKNIQGDHYQYMEPDGPFLALNVVKIHRKIF